MFTLKMLFDDYPDECNNEMLISFCEHDNACHVGGEYASLEMMRIWPLKPHDEEVRNLYQLKNFSM